MLTKMMRIPRGAFRRLVITSILLGAIPTRAVGATLEETVDLIVGLELGQSLEELRKRFPELKRVDDASGANPRETYVHAWGHPLLRDLALGVRDSRLRSLGAFDGAFDGGWETADAVVQYAPALIEKISEKWGPAHLVLRRLIEQELVTATWRRNGEVLWIQMTPPRQLAAEAGQNRNPSGLFSLLRFVEDVEPDLKQQMSKLRALEGEEIPIGVDQLAVDYGAYRARMEVQPRKQTEKYFPAELKGTYIGMPISEFKAVRSHLQSGDFFDDRYAFFDTARQNEVAVRYAARMDRLVAAVFEDARLPSRSQDVSEPWRDWLLRTWGAPSSIQWRQYTTERGAASARESIFVWTHAGCDSAVAVVERPGRPTRIAVFEQGLDPGLNFAGYGHPRLVATTRDRSIVLRTWQAFLEGRDVFVGFGSDSAAAEPRVLPLPRPSG